MENNFNYTIPLRDHVYIIPTPKTEEEYKKLLEEMAYLGKAYATIKEV